MTYKLRYWHAMTMIPNLWNGEPWGTIPFFNSRILTTILRRRKRQQAHPTIAGDQPTEDKLETVDQWIKPTMQWLDYSNRFDR